MCVEEGKLEQVETKVIDPHLRGRCQRGEATVNAVLQRPSQ